MSLTIVRSDPARAQRKSNDTLRRKLGGIFGGHHVHCCFAHTVSEEGRYFRHKCEIRVAKTRSNVDDLLRLALSDQWEKGVDRIHGVEEVDFDLKVTLAFRPLKRVQHRTLSFISRSKSCSFPALGSSRSVAFTSKDSSNSQAYKALGGSIVASVPTVYALQISTSTFPPLAFPTSSTAFCSLFGSPMSVSTM